MEVGNVHSTVTLESISLSISLSAYFFLCSLFYFVACSCGNGGSIYVMTLMILIFTFFPLTFFFSFFWGVGYLAIFSCLLFVAIASSSFLSLYIPTQLLVLSSLPLPFVHAAHSTYILTSVHIQGKSFVSASIIVGVGLSPLTITATTIIS